MTRQTLLAFAALAGLVAGPTAASAKPIALDCDLARKVQLSRKITPMGNAKETVSIDLVAKKLTVGKWSGGYVVARPNEASMTGLPQGMRIAFNTSDNYLTIVKTSEFGEVDRQDGKCVPKGR